MPDPSRQHSYPPDVALLMGGHFYDMGYFYEDHDKINTVRYALNIKDLVFMNDL